MNPLDILAGLSGVIKSSDGSVQFVLVLIYILILTLGIIKPGIFNKVRGKNKIYTSDDYKSFVTNNVTKSLRIREETIYKINKIEFAIMRDQMAFAENALERAKNEQLKAYSKTLHDRIARYPILCVDGERPCLATSQQISSNIQIYDSLLDVIYKEVLSETRRACRDNGFDQMTDGEYELYLQQITGVCLSKGEIIMRQHYNTHVMILTYDEGKETVNQNMVAKQTAEVFRHARHVTIKAKAKIRDIEAGYIKKLDEILDIDV